MASLLRQVGTGANSQSLEEARKRVFHFLREACRSIQQIMETYNIHEVITPSQLRSVVVAQFRKQAHVTNPKCHAINAFIGGKPKALGANISVHDDSLSDEAKHVVTLAIEPWWGISTELENTLNYGLERVWAIGYMKSSNRVAIGYDEGAIMIKIGREEPVASLDSSGKIIWAKNVEIQTVNIKAVGGDFESLKHNPNGRFVVVCGDGEYIIYTALAWRNRSFGSALEFVWASDGEYAVRESTSKIKIFSKTFQVIDMLIIKGDEELRNCLDHSKQRHHILGQYVIGEEGLIPSKVGAVSSGGSDFLRKFYDSNNF